jgi:hypothetical protein
MTAEYAPQPERRINAVQEETLRTLCDRYGVQYAAEHYYVYPSDSIMMPGWAEGWVGGPQHANPDYARPEEPVGNPTIFVGVSPEGEAHS